jgi:hypothetical protein
MEEAISLMELNGLIRTAIRTIKCVELRLTATEMGYSVFSFLPGFKVGRRLRYCVPVATTTVERPTTLVVAWRRWSAGAGVVQAQRRPQRVRAAGHAARWELHLIGRSAREGGFAASTYTAALCVARHAAQA